jgi:hypothetical protein
VKDVVEADALDSLFTLRLFQQAFAELGDLQLLLSSIPFDENINEAGLTFGGMETTRPADSTI